MTSTGQRKFKQKLSEALKRCHQLDREAIAFMGRIAGTNYSKKALSDGWEQWRSEAMVQRRIIHNLMVQVYFTDRAARNGDCLNIKLADQSLTALVRSVHRRVMFLQSVSDSLKLPRHGLGKKPR